MLELHISIINFITKIFLPIYIVVGIIINLINSIIFSSKNEKFNKPIYQYLKMNSIVDTIILIFSSGITFLFSDLIYDYTSFLYSYWYKVYHLYYVLLIGKVMNTLSSCINIKMSLDRFMSLKEQQSSLRTRIESPRNLKRYMVIFSVFSVVLHSPNVLLFQIKQKTFLNANVSLAVDYYDLELSEMALKSQILVPILYMLHIAVNVLNLILMVFLSLLTIVYIRRNCDKLFYELGLIAMNKHIKSFENDRIITRLKKLESKTNKMILYMSAIFIINELMVSIGYVSEFINRSTNNINFTTQWICIIVTSTYITNFSCNTFLYLKYSEPFLKNFKNLFKKLKTIIFEIIGFK